MLRLLRFAPIHCMVLLWTGWSVPFAAAAGGVSDLSYSSYLTGYSNTWLEWEQTEYYCLGDLYTDGYNYYCYGVAEAIAPWVGVNGALYTPSNSFAEGDSRQDLSYATISYNTQPTEAGTWMVFADHYVAYDHFFTYCLIWSCNEWGYEYTEYDEWSSDADAYVSGGVPGLTWMSMTPDNFIAPGCFTHDWDTQFPIIDYVWHHIEPDAYGTEYNSPNGTQRCIGEEDIYQFGHYEITSVRVPGGMWVAPPQSVTLFIQAPPYLHTGNLAAGNCGTVERGSSITAVLENAGSLAGFVWRFTAAAGTITNQNANNVQWTGTMVTSGTIRVDYNGGFKECTVTVSNRNWSLPLPPLDHPFGSPPGYRGLTLTQPIAAVSDLGAFAFDYDSGPNQSAGLGSQVAVNDGPNKDFAYFTTAPSGWNAYWINPDLDYTNPGQETGKPNTQFANKQCGNYNGTNGGFISWQNLVEQTRRHEFNHATASHRGKLATLLAQGATNLGVFLENKVWGPGTNTTLNQFNTQLVNDFTNLITSMQTNVGTHTFPGVNENAGGVPLGNINLPPYQTAPLCP